MRIITSFGYAAVLLALVSLECTGQILITGTLDIAADEASYDGQDLVISNGTVTVRGSHGFGSVSLVATSRFISAWSAGVTNLQAMTAFSIGGQSIVDLGGGTMLLVSNLMQLASGAVVNAQAISNNSAVGGGWIGQGPQIEAGALMLASGSVITANAQGYGSAGDYDAWGVGPGAGAPGSYSGGGGGGGHGGTGGRGKTGAGGAVYGSALQPVMLGSGAGSGWNGYGFRRSGGAVRITAGAMQLDGVISADGQDGSNDVGGGSGGSIWIHAGTLQGGGLLQANGGIGAGTCGGGGGGRIAVYYGVATGYTAFAQCTAAGGAGYSAGQPGSVGFFDTNVPGLRLSVFTTFNCTNLVQVAEALVSGGLDSRWDNGATIGSVNISGGARLQVSNSVAVGTGLVSQAAQLRLCGGGVFSNLAVSSTGKVVVAGAQVLQADTLSLTNDASIEVEARDINGQLGGQWVATGGVVLARSIFIATNCRIGADAQGYGSAGDYDAWGVGPGAGGAGSYSGGGGGGGHGGDGGRGKTGVGGAAYGSAFQPVTVGSGAGSGWNGYGLCRAGGAMVIGVDHLVLDGLITAQGANGTSDVGGGAGGSVLLLAGRIEGGGALKADGGTGSGTCGGGGGGRIAVYYGTATGYTGFARCTASGGAGWASGGAGSVGFIDTNEPSKLFVFYAFSCTDDLHVADAVITGGQISRWSRGAAVERLELGGGSGIVIEGPASFGMLSLSGGSSMVISNHALVATGLVQQASTLRLGAGGAFSNLLLSATGSVTLAGGQVLQAVELSLTNGAGVVVEARDNNGQIEGHWAATGSFVLAETLLIATNCYISSDGQGYGSTWSYGPGDGLGGGAGGAYSGYGSGGGGAGHGGAGGAGRRGAGGVVYGSVMTPVAVGSGGGTGIDTYPTRRGGGAIGIEADQLWMDGTIRANGQDGANDVGGGSGGAILMRVGTLAGGGSLQAKGGAGGGTAGGGGGGRIAVYCGTYSNFTGRASCSVEGGAGWQPGNSGTFFLNSTWESWLAEYWPSGGSGGPTNDVDDDGASNEAEYLAGTNPTNGQSCFQVIGTETNMTPQGFMIQWNSQADRWYAVQRTTNLVPPAVFVNMQSYIPGQSNVTSYTDTSATGAGPFFYRVRLEP